MRKLGIVRRRSHSNGCDMKAKPNDAFLEAAHTAGRSLEGMKSVFDICCYSARRFDADRRANPLRFRDSRGLNYGSVAISMLSVAYGRQILANGGQIDNLKASQRQMQGCADPDALSIRLVATVRRPHHRD